MTDDTQALPCADKLTFDNRVQASASANVVHYQHGTKVHPYLCSYCELWHLSSRASSQNDENLA